MASGEISDAELRDRLIKLGEYPGPITDTTRKLYLHKLRALTRSGETSPTQKPTKAKIRPRTPPLSSSQSPPPSYNDSSPGPDLSSRHPHTSATTVATPSPHHDNQPLPQSPQLIAGNVGM